MKFRVEQLAKGTANSNIVELWRNLSEDERQTYDKGRAEQLVSFWCWIMDHEHSELARYVSPLRGQCTIIFHFISSSRCIKCDGANTNVS